MVSANRSIQIDSPENSDELLDHSHRENILSSITGGNEFGQLLTTFLTTLAVYGVFFGQGILIARILGPVGRGEFGTAVLFTHQILLYVGLLGGIEVVTRYAANQSFDTRELKYSAASLGMFSGVLTATVGALLSCIVFFGGEKAYLIPYCLLVCLFVPWEHIHLNVSAVDRGRQDYTRYNINRLIFAAAFPLSVMLFVIFGLRNLPDKNILLVVCALFVVSRIFGLLPTLRGLNLREWFASFGNKRNLTEVVGKNKSELSENEIHHTDVPTAKTLLRDGAPYALAMFASELFERLDILLIVLLASVQDSGFYFVSVPAAALLTIAPNALSVFTFNAGASDRYIEKKSALSIISALAVFQLISLCVLWLLIPQLIVLFYGEPFRPAILFVWYLLPACAIKGFLQPLDGYLKGCGKPLIGVWARFLSVFVMLGFVFFFYSKFQLLSIPMAACVGQSVSMLIITVFVILEVTNRQKFMRELA